MWKLLWVAILVAVLSTYHTDANRKRDISEIKNKKRQVQFLQAPFFESLKTNRDDLNAIVIDSPEGYYYTTPKTEGYIYTKGGYVYETPTITTRITRSTKPSTPGTTYLPPTTTTTPSTTTTTTTTTPSTTTTTTTTTPSTTTTTFKPTYLPPYKNTYLPPPEKVPPRVYIPPKLIPYPPVNYTHIPTIRTTERYYNYTGTPYSRPTLPPSTSPRPYIGYEYLPPDKEYLPAFETRK